MSHAIIKHVGVPVCRSHLVRMRAPSSRSPRLLILHQASTTTPLSAGSRWPAAVSSVRACSTSSSSRSTPCTCVHPSHETLHERPNPGLGRHLIHPRLKTKTLTGRNLV